MSKAGAPVGNTNSAKGREWADAIRRALARRKDSGGTVDGGLNKLADQFLQAVADGGVAEFRELGDRMDGKPTQALDIGGQEDNPLQIESSQRPQLTPEQWAEIFGPK